MKKFLEIITVFTMMLSITTITPVKAAYFDDDFSFYGNVIVYEADMPANEIWTIAGAGSTHSASFSVPWEDLTKDESGTAILQEIEIVDIRSSDPEIFEVTEAEERHHAVAFKGVTKKEGDFTITLDLLVDGNLHTYTSEPRTFIYKNVNMNVYEGVDEIKSEKDFKDMKEVTALETSKTYHLDATIDGYSLWNTNLSNYFMIDDVKLTEDVQGKENSVQNGSLTYFSTPLQYLQPESRSGIGSINWLLTITSSEATSKKVKMFVSNMEHTVSLEKELIFNAPLKINDDHTNVKLESEANVLPQNSTLNVDVINDSELIKKSLIGVSEKFYAYDITILNDGKKIQPNGNVTLRLPIPSSYDKERLNVYYVDDEGNLEKLKFSLEENEIVFETNHFSYYVIAQIKNNMDGNSQSGNQSEEVVQPENQNTDTHYEATEQKENVVKETSSQREESTIVESVLILFGAALIFNASRKSKKHIK